MPALEIYEFDEFPSAYDVFPSSYSQLGLIPNRGRVVEIAGSEKRRCAATFSARYSISASSESAEFQQNAAISES